MLTPSFLGDVLVVGIVVLIAGHTAWLRRRGRWLALEPLTTFWAGVLVCYVSQPIAHGDLFVSWLPEGVFEETLLYTLLGLLFVVLGYESRIGDRLGRRLPALPPSLSPNRLKIAAAVLIGLGFVGYAIMFASAGGASQWLSVGRGGTDYDNLTAYVFQLEAILPLGVSLLVFHVSMHPTFPPTRAVAWSLAGLMLLWFVYLGSRSRTIAFSVTAMLAYYLPRRRNPGLVLLAVVFVGLAIVVAFQARYRSQFVNLSLNLDRIDWSEARDEIEGTWLGSSRTAGGQPSGGVEFNVVMTTVALVPSRIPYNYGYGHLELLTRPVPRVWWPDKVYPHAEAYTPILAEGNLSTSVVRTSKRYLLMGPSFTFVGHWYSVGGPIALILAGFLTGIMFRTMRAIYDRSPGNQSDTILFATLVLIGFGEAAAEPLFWLFAAPFTQGVVLILLYLCRDRGAKPGPRTC